MAQKSSHPSKIVVKKCNKALLNIVYFAVRVYYAFCGIKVKVTNKVEGEIEKPSIVLCSHGSFIDFYFAARLLRKSGPNFVAARLYFYHKLLGWLLRTLGAFPKSMFATDLESTKNCIKVLKEGWVLAMMPEARLSTVGRFEDIQETTYSFLKKSNVTVYTIKMNGDYLANPKWGKGLRKGSFVEAEMDILFTAEQIGKLTLDEIKQAVEKRLYYNEVKWLETKPDLKYRSKNLAEGLENILIICPKCKRKHIITTKGREIFCENCGKLTEIDDRYAFDDGFEFKNFALWYDWQKEFIKTKILENQDYKLQSEVELRLPSIDGKSLTRSAGSGVCTLDASGLKFVGKRDGEDFQIGFSIERVYRLLFGAGENFEIYNGSEILYFVPKEKRSAVEWYITSMIFNDMAAKKEKILVK